MPDSQKKKPTQEEKDDERLREIEARMKELANLMGERTDRGQADERLQAAREAREKHRGNTKQQVFHSNKSTPKPIPVNMDTKSALDLAEALKTRIRLGEYALDLQDSLNRLAAEQVEVLERCLKRTRY